MDQVLSEAAVGERVRALVEAALAGHGPAPATAPGPPASASLRDAGLSSMEVVNLMMAVEDAFGLELPQAEMTAENFHSAQSIAALVRRLA